MSPKATRPFAVGRDRALCRESADTTDNDMPDGLAALIGAAARLKLSSPAGEIDIDKRGMKQLKK